MSDTDVLNDNSITGGEEQNFDISSDFIRGHINTIILRSLYDGDKYGYDIINEIKKKSGGMYSLKEPTLYSALKRLESQKYVASYYGEYSNGGKRKYFSLTQLGREFTEKNLSEWEYSRTIIDSLISDGSAHYDFSFITHKQQELTELQRSLAIREQAIEDEKISLNQMKNELQRKHSLISAQSSSLTSQKSDFNELKEKLSAQSAALEEKENSLQEKQVEIETKELLLSEKEHEIESTKAELEGKIEEIHELKSLLEQLQESFETKDMEVSSLQKENADLQAKNAELTEETLTRGTASNEELEELKKSLLFMQGELDDKKAVITSLNMAISTQENTINLLKEDQENRNTEYFNRSLELRSQQAQLDAQRSKLEEEKQALDEKNAQIEALKHELEEKETALSKREAENTSLLDEQSSLAESRNELETKLQTLEVERDTLRAEYESLEKAKLALEEERDTLNALKLSLQSEREQIDQKTYELTKLEESFHEKERALADQQSEATASTEEISRQLNDIQERENELSKNTRKLQDDLSSLLQQQKELAARQALYNQQQLEFIARKNALSAQQFDLADKSNAYNVQAKLFNENLEKLEADRALLQAEKEAHETAVKEFECEKEKFNLEQQDLMKAQKNMHDETSGLDARLQDLKEREQALSQREDNLAKQSEEFNRRVMNAPSRTYYNSEYRQNPYYGMPNPQPYEQQRSLYERAQSDGITLRTAGNATMYNQQPEPQLAVAASPTSTKTGFYNVGTTLIKSAFIMLCILTFESLAVYFLLDYLTIPSYYPAIAFALGFTVFLICAILYSKGFRPHVRRRKNPSYLLTNTVLFIIFVILTTMVAVYLKADLSDPKQLISYIIIPVVYLSNILVFTAFYHTFSKHNNA